MDSRQKFKPNGLVSIDDLDLSDIKTLYSMTLEFKKILERPVKKVPALKDITVANLFFEDSTRTRISFELAEKRLGADVINFSASMSSLKKGESLNDTVQNLIRMKIDLIVVRHNISGTANYIQKKTRIPVVNAGDGTNEHPTQALLDLFTMWYNCLNKDELYVILRGDVAHSRVAGSAIKLWNKTGVNYKILGPQTVMRRNLPMESIPNDHRPFNIAYNLRIQRERQNIELIPSFEEYNQFFGNRRQDLIPGIFYMHPGPINRGVELDSEIADAPSSLVLDQVEMGVALRMAIIYLLAQKKEA